jgi:hypothetical protein
MRSVDVLNYVQLETLRSYERGTVMTMRCLVTAAAIIVATCGASYAGPCSKEIDRVQAKIDAQLEAAAAAGSPGAESTGATLHHQPTPDSIAAAEGQLGELSPDQATSVFAAMRRARDADAAGDQSACVKNLNEVQRILGE